MSAVPAISVVMSAYNAEEFIGDAMDSILNQSFSDFEFIVIDDASTDNTLKLIREYTDPRIVVLANERNMFLAASLNRGIKIARGKYIARMDADDVSHLERLERLYDYMEDHPDTDICGAAIQLMGDGEIWKYSVEDRDIKAGLIWGSTMAHATVMMRRDTLVRNDTTYDETLRVGQDWMFWYKAMNFVRFANLPETLYYYRRGAQSITQQNSKGSFERHAMMFRLILNEMGVSFSHENVRLHQFIIGMFTLTPSPGTVKKAKSWMEGLIRHNQKVNRFDPARFEAIARQRWSRLFYLLVPFGLGVAFSYWRVSGISVGQVYYFLSWHVRQWK